MYRLIPLLIVLLGACSGSESSQEPAGSAPVADALPSAPWERQLSPAEAPDVLLAEWREAENRATCAPLAPVSLAPYSEAQVRAANFGGGWGIAYDLPGRRSAFGIAGTGVRASAPSYHEWPHHQNWADGSRAGYGPEGGTGPKQLAYLRIPGQECLYNVWSHMGREHLEHLFTQLRIVATDT